MKAESLINSMSEAWGNPPPPRSKFNPLGGRVTLGGDVVPDGKTGSMDSNDPREVRAAVSDKLKEAAKAVMNVWISDYPSTRYDQTGVGGYRAAKEDLIVRFKKIGKKADALMAEIEALEDM